MADGFGDRPKRRARSDRLKLFMIADQDELGAGPFDLVDEAGELTAADHAALVDDEDVTSIEPTAISLPAVFPRRQCAARDAGRLLQAFRRLAGQCRAMNAIALRFPGLAGSCQHRALAGTGKADHHGDLTGTRDMLDRLALFRRQPLPR